MKHIFDIFIQYIHDNNLFDKKDKILLAVSGGRDSMAMLKLFEIAGFYFAVAHFNHKTRNGESDKDEAFVRDYCKDKNIEFYSHSMDINAIIRAEKKGNFQDVARYYRYKWLREVKDIAKCKYIATAHHSDDNIETFLFYLARGMDIAGLNGIPPVNDDIIRPILCLSRKDIDTLVKQYNIPFREDASNAETKYARNKIRHKIIPAFQEIFPDFKSRILSVIQSNKRRNTAFDFLVKKYFDDFISTDKDEIFIDKRICDTPENRSILYYHLLKYGFNESQYKNILDSCDKTGKIFYSNSYILLIDRKYFIIKKSKKEQNTEILISPGENHIDENTVLRITVIRPQEILDIKNPGIQYLDKDKVQLPLKLRRWQDGDFYYPFGLKGKTKKLKKLFTDKKLSLFDKKRQFVLLSGNYICAIIPLDTDYRFRVDENTRDVLKIELIGNK